MNSNHKAYFVVEEEDGNDVSLVVLLCNVGFVELFVVKNLAGSRENTVTAVPSERHI